MLNGHYQPALVLTSILVAILASYCALRLAGRVSEARARAPRLAWTVGGAAAMGSGIWAMHFIGMLAFRLPIALGFDLPITVVSLLLPIAASSLALWQVSRADLSPARLLLSAVAMGIGINMMHYTGMAALRMDPGIVYDPGLFALSVAIAIAASGLALWIAFRLRRDVPQVWIPRLLAAVVMGSAIVGMHYTGMAAAGFPADSVCRAAAGGVPQDGLAMPVVVAVLCVLGLALLASLFDARLEANARVLAQSEATAAERQTLLNRERAARDEAEYLSSLKDEFLATLSHELRTPLNAILGWAAMLQRGVKDEATLRRGLDTIERNARAQGRLIEDLLDMSRIVAGTLRLDVQGTDLARVVDAAMATVQPAAEAKQIDLRADLERAGMVLRADPGRLQQVLWNLLSNAVKFTPDGGTVRVALRRETASHGHAHGKSEVGAEYVVIEVADSGSGIAPAFLPYVFDRFRQQDASITRQHGGLGLGLSIVRQLVELHGGTIAVESPGALGGATFTVRLPVTRVRQSTDAARAGAGKPDSAAGVTLPAEVPDLAGLKVLVVDDAPDTLGVLEQILRGSGALTLVAADAVGALALLDQERPDVIVSDIGMPQVDGFEFMRRVRASAAGRAVPAIALTAFTRQDDRDKAREAGFDAYLAKPVEAQALLGCIVGAVHGRRANTDEEGKDGEDGGGRRPARSR